MAGGPARNLHQIFSSVYDNFWTIEKGRVGRCQTDFSDTRASALILDLHKLNL